MAGTKITDVTKLNKGTSRDQWGDLNFFGYKTSDGQVRARLYADGSFEVKSFDISMVPSWKSTLNWNEAHVIGEGFIDLTGGDKAEKGLLGKDMVDDINAIIEIHNDKFGEYVGNKYLVPDHNGLYSNSGHEVLGVSVHYGSDGSLETRAQFSEWDLKRTHGTSKVDDLKEFSVESQQKILATQVQACRDTMQANNKTVNDLLEAFENGTPAPEDFDVWSASQGVPRHELNAILQGITDIQEQKAAKAKKEEASQHSPLVVDLMASS